MDLTNKKRIIFVGIPDMGIVCLDNLLKNNFQIVGVVPPYKDNCTYNYFKDFVISKNLNLLEFNETPNEKEYIEKLRELNADIGVVCSYNNLLSKEFLNTTKFGYLNCHPSYLPDYRGASPYFHVIKNNEKQSGVTIHFMDETFDTGDIVYQEEFNILPFETMGILFNRTTFMLSDALVKVLKTFEKTGKLDRIQQGKENYKQAPKVDGNFRIRWKTNSVDEIEALIRACNPFYNAFSFFRNTNMKIIKAHIVQYNNSKNYGEIMEANENQLLVQAKGGILALDVVQIGTWGIFNPIDFYYTFSPKIGEKIV